MPDPTYRFLSFSDQSTFTECSLADGFIIFNLPADSPPEADEPPAQTTLAPFRVTRYVVTNLGIYWTKLNSRAKLLLGTSFAILAFESRRDAGVAELARLESVCA